MAEIRIPDLGDFDEVEVVEVHVKEGESIKEGDPILTLETEKAAMDVQSNVSGVIEKVSVSLGEKVSNGDLVSTVSSESETDQKHESIEKEEELNKKIEFTDSVNTPMGSEHDYHLIVVGAGPGGYAAAFRASDLGLKVALVDKNSRRTFIPVALGDLDIITPLHSLPIISISSVTNFLSL